MSAGGCGRVTITQNYDVKAGRVRDEVGIGLYLFFNLGGGIRAVSVGINSLN